MGVLTEAGALSLPHTVLISSVTQWDPTNCNCCLYSSSEITKLICLQGAHGSYAERDNSYDPVCLSVRPSVILRCGIISTKEDLRSCGFHQTVVQRF